MTEYLQKRFRRVPVIFIKYPLALRVVSKLHISGLGFWLSRRTGSVTSHYLTVTHHFPRNNIVNDIISFAEQRF